MNKKDLIGVIAAKTGLAKKDAEAAVKAFTEAVVEEVAKKGKVQLIGFGTFMTRDRASRNGKNPATGESIVIPAATVPAFKAGKEFKVAVNPAPKKAAVKKVAKKGKKK